MGATRNSLAARRKPARRRNHAVRLRRTALQGAKAAPLRAAATLDKPAPGTHVEVVAGDVVRLGRDVRSFLAPATHGEEDAPSLWRERSAGLALLLLNRQLAKRSNP